MNLAPLDQFIVSLNGVLGGVLNTIIGGIAQFLA